MPRVTLCPLMRRHLSAVTWLDRACYAQASWSRHDWARMASAPGYIAVVALDRGRVVGVLLTYGDRSTGTLHVIKLAVAPDCRRRGIATVLLTRLMIRIADPESRWTFGEALVSTRAESLPAACLLRSLGWLGSETSAGRMYRFEWCPAMAAQRANAPAIVA